jgi:hypothetical protein
MVKRGCFHGPFPFPIQVGVILLMKQKISYRMLKKINKIFSPALISPAPVRVFSLLYQNRTSQWVNPFLLLS